MFYGAFYSHLVLVWYLPVPKQTFLGILSLFCATKAWCSRCSTQWVFVCFQPPLQSVFSLQRVCCIVSQWEPRSWWMAGAVFCVQPGVCVFCSRMGGVVCTTAHILLLQQLQPVSKHAVLHVWSLAARTGGCQASAYAGPTAAPKGWHPRPCCGSRGGGGRNVPGTFVLFLSAGGRTWFFLCADWSAAPRGRLLLAERAAVLWLPVSPCEALPVRSGCARGPAVVFGHRPPLCERGAAAGRLGASGRVRRGLGGSGHAAREGRR